MSERRTRRQAALAAAAATTATATPTADEANDTLTNISQHEATVNGNDNANNINKVGSNGNGIASLDPKVDNYPKENIFLFWPNIIGMRLLCSCNTMVLLHSFVVFYMIVTLVVARTDLEA